MGGLLSVLAPLALVSTPVPTEAAPELDSQPSRFANVLVTSYLCDVLGYRLDYPGIVDWGHEIRGDLIEAGMDADEAMATMQREVRVKRARFNRYQGVSLVNSVSTQVRATFLSGPSEAQYRFQKTYTDRCNDLAQSTTLGAYFTPPEKRLSGQELARRLRALFFGNRGGLS